MPTRLPRSIHQRSAQRRDLLSHMHKRFTLVNRKTTSSSATCCASTVRSEQADGSGNGNGNGSGSGSHPGDGEAILTAVKGNGAGSIEGPIPGVSDGYGGGHGDGSGGGGSGSNGGGGGSDGDDSKHNSFVVFAGLLAAAAGLYAGFQMLRALQKKYQDQPSTGVSNQERYVNMRSQHLSHPYLQFLTLIPAHQSQAT